MPDGLALALSAPGLPILLLMAFVAGTVYGFAGFGAALIFMPVAVVLLPPATAIAAFSLSATAALVTVVPGAWRVADRPATVGMIAVAFAFTPLGVWALRMVEAETMRTAVSAVVLVTLAALLAGWRLRTGSGWGARGAVAATAGVLAGSTGLNGPPVILFNLGTDQPVAVTRGNLTVFLTVSSLGVLPQLWAQGMLGADALWLGALLLAPYAIGTRAGAALFDPDRARLYRGAAYTIIGAAGVAGLPLFR